MVGFFFFFFTKRKKTASAYYLPSLTDGSECKKHTGHSDHRICVILAKTELHQHQSFPIRNVILFEIPM